MSPERMEHLLSLAAPLIVKKDTNFQKAIPPAQRLMLTLRFFASGDSQISLTYLFRMGKKTVSRVISETSEALYEVLSKMHLNAPKNSEEFQRSPKNFKNYGDFRMLSELSMGSIFVFRPQIKVGLCFIIAKGFLAFSYWQFVILSTILHSLMWDNMDLIMIALSLRIQISPMPLKVMR